VERLVRLEDERARDPAIAGSKAAALARARSAGLPVLPGWVLPAEEAANALREGIRALERSSAAAAYLTIVEAPLDPAVHRDLTDVAERVGPSAIVRSSTVQEADPTWAGAFATYADVAKDDLPTAVRGCWASAFSGDVLARCSAVGVAPGGLQMAVLIQPWVDLDAGGTAVLEPDGSVRVAVAVGSPAELVAGRADGTLARVTPGGSVVTEADPDVEPEVLAAVAALARASGGGTVEWGCLGGRVLLLQLRRTPARSERPRRAHRRSRRTLPPNAERVATLATRFPGPLGDRLVLPWAFAPYPVRVPAAARISVGDGVAALAEASELAGALTAHAWGASGALAERDAAHTLRSILGPDPVPGLERISTLRPVDPAAAARLLGLVRGIARMLVDRGVLASEELVWRLSIEELERTLEGGDSPPERLGPGRWEPYVFTVVSNEGYALTGAGAAAGIGAGRLRVHDGSPLGDREGGREVLALEEPVPQVAPLLWNAAGLVTAGGSVGAHLFEVARSLGVPAVTGVELSGAAEGSLAAIDGDAGTVFVLPSARARTAEAGA
jgi:phosphohistidine swiveling domain-containing protein